MRYLDTAFGQLAAAWKLYSYALDGHIDLDSLDTPITFKEGAMVMVLPDKIFNANDDLILFLENNLSIHFGVAAITLNRAREEAGIKLPQEIITEDDQFVCVAYQIRNAFAHDISEPRWHAHGRYRRRFEFGGITVDLSDLHNAHFRYEDIGGPDVIFRMKEYAETRLFSTVIPIRPAVVHEPKKE